MCRSCDGCDEHPHLPGPLPRPPHDHHGPPVRPRAGAGPHVSHGDRGDHPQTGQHSKGEYSGGTYFTPHSKVQPHKQRIWIQEESQIALIEN